MNARRIRSGIAETSRKRDLLDRLAQIFHPDTRHLHAQPLYRVGRG
jgi:hypothetical protein